MELVSALLSTRHRYAREDNLLGKSLLREGQALRELFRRPVVHGALQDPASREPRYSRARQSSSFALVQYCTAVLGQGGRRECFRGVRRDGTKTCDPPGEMPRAERRSERQCSVSRNIKDSGFVRRQSRTTGVSKAVGRGCLGVVLGRPCSAAVLSLWL